MRSCPLHIWCVIHSRVVSKLCSGHRVIFSHFIAYTADVFMVHESSAGRCLFWMWAVTIVWGAFLTSLKLKMSYSFDMSNASLFLVVWTMSVTWWYGVRRWWWWWCFLTYLQGSIGSHHCRSTTYWSIHPFLWLSIWIWISTRINVTDNLCLAAYCTSILISSVFQLIKTAP